MLMIKSLYQKNSELEREKKEAAEEKIQLTKQNEASILKAKLASAADQKSSELKLPEDLTLCKAKEALSDFTISSGGLNSNTHGSSNNNSAFSPSSHEQRFYAQQVVEAQMAAVISERDLAYRHLQDIKHAGTRRGFFCY